MEEADAERSLTNDETLESLLRSSKTLEGRSHLASTLPLLTLLRLLPSASSRLLLPRLRLLRNLCAGETAVQDSFVQSNGPDFIASALLGPPRAPPEALRVGLQVLGNASLAGEDHRSLVWARFFPDGFLDLARVRGPPGVCDPLSMVLDTCCSAEGGRRRSRELCRDERGLTIVVELIRTAFSEGYQEEWLEWLLTKVCIEDLYFPELFAKLGSLGDSDRSDDGPQSQYIRFTGEQAFLFRLLSKCLSERPGEVVVSNEFGLGVLKILKEASGSVDFSSRGSSELPTGSPAIDVLGYTLLILRDICAWEHFSSPDTEPPVNSLLSTGILELVLNLLRELEPPLIVKKSISHANKQEVQLNIAETKKLCPYKGYRRDVVSVISNCLRRKKQVQDEVRERNGILLLLQQCVIDEDNPFLREWGLLAIWNLLDGNLENQNEVAELQLQGPVQTPEIANLGLKVEVDEISGRAKLVNIPSYMLKDWSYEGDGNMTLFVMFSGDDSIFKKRMIEASKPLKVSLRTDCHCSSINMASPMIDTASKAVTITLSDILVCVLNLG